MLMTTWNHGRALLRASWSAMPSRPRTFSKNVSSPIVRVPGTAIFLASVTGGTPLTLVPRPGAQPRPARSRRSAECHHRRGTPTCRPRGASRGSEIGQQLLPRQPALRLHAGNQHPQDAGQTPATISLASSMSLLQISYFLSRKTVVPSSKPGMAIVARETFRLDGAEFCQRRWTSSAYP